MALSKFEKWAASVQAVTAVSSVIIATVALNISYTERSSNNYYLQIAHKPIIQFSFHEGINGSEEDFVGYEIENRGPGYALVAPMYILSPDGNCINTPESIGQLSRDKPSNLIFWTNHGISVLKPGDKQKLLWMHASAFDPERDAATVKFLRETLLVLPYCSLTGQDNLALIADDDKLSISEESKIKIKGEAARLFEKYFKMEGKI